MEEFDEAPQLTVKREPLEPIERPQSPEVNCAICLERFNNRSYTNSCLHQFCYLCLKEWSKIKAECPLCKTQFNTIIHNVRALNDYDEYHVTDPAEARINEATSFLINFEIPRRSSGPMPGFDFPHPHPRRNMPYDNVRDARLSEMNEAFRHLTSIIPRSSILPRPRHHHHAHAPPPPPPPVLSYSSILLSNSGGFRNSLRDHNAASSSDMDFSLNGRTRSRREVYRFNRWVRPSNSNRIRDCSPEFFRLNPAQMHRLVPWLTRELNILLDVAVDSRTVVDQILALLTVHHIRSREFREALREYLGPRVEHFLHEFYHFARSNHDMLAYDLVAQYDPPVDAGSYPLPLLLSENSDDSDVEVVHVLTKREGEDETEEQTSGLDLTNRPGPSSAGPHSPEIVITIDSDSSDDDVEIIEVRPKTPEVRVPKQEKTESRPSRQSYNRHGPSSNATPNTVITIDSDSSDDIEIIEVRPKTPELVTVRGSSESESDSELCMVNVESNDEPRGEQTDENNFETVRNVMGDIEAALLEYPEQNIPPVPTVSPPAAHFIKSMSPESPCQTSGPNSPASLVLEIGVSHSNSPQESENHSSSVNHPNGCTTCSTSSSASSSSTSSSSDSYSAYNKKRAAFRKKRKAPPIFNFNNGKKQRKRLRKTTVKNEDDYADSSSGEEYVPRSSRRRLKSVVVKPPPKTRRLTVSYPHYPNSDSE